MRVSPFDHLKNPFFQKTPKKPFSFFTVNSANQVLTHKQQKNVLVENEWFAKKMIKQFKKTENPKKN